MARKARDFDRWVKLTLQFSRGALALNYEDETGHVSPAKDVAEGIVAPPLDGSPGLEAISTLVHIWFVPSDLAGLLTEALSPFRRTRQHLLPGEKHSQISVPWLLPVFVVPPRGLEALPWEAWIQQALFSSSRLRACIAVRLLETRVPLSPLPLPLRIFDERWTPSTDFLRNRSWFADEVAVRSHGIVLEDRRTGLSARPAPQIFITESGDDRKRIDKRELRLIVRVAEAGEVAPLSAERPLIRLTVPKWGEQVDVDPVANIVYALVHDFALHEIAWILAQAHPSWIIEVACDQRSNHALRLSRTLTKLRDDILAGRIVPSLPPDVPRATRERRVQEARYLAYDFTRESRGFSSMARLMAGALSPAAIADTTSERAASDPRRVDMALDRYDEFGIPGPIDHQGRFSPLRCGWRYRLRFQIGLPDPDSSLFEEPPPPLDELLPPVSADEGHDLEVCVYSKEFELLSPGTLSLRLPPRGPSDPVFFEIRAPQEGGQADLRVAVYHRNNLLQSFQLLAIVKADGPINEIESYGIRVDTPLVMRLTSSALDDLSDAAALKPRALSVATNDDSRLGKHTLMVKGHGSGIDTPIDESAVAELNKAFRAVLERAHDRRATFEEAVRDLAQVGSKLHKLLERSRAGSDPTLLELRRSEEQTVQFARHGNRLNLPWQLVYDFKVPTGDDFRSPRICSGGRVVGEWPGSGRYGCRHMPNERVICFEGFWAYRHYLELISEDKAKDAKEVSQRMQAVHAPEPHPLVTFGWSVVPTLASALADKWQKLWPGRVHAITYEDAPVNECLWKANRQPAMLVLLSHLHAADPPSNLVRRVYACSPEDEDHEISADNLLEVKGERNAWVDPARPVVLLLACDSTGRDVDDMVDLTDTFLQTGAAAVIGTSWDIRADPALAFAEHAAQGLLASRQPLGKVMRDYYRAAFAQRDGIPILLTAYGNADLTIAEDRP